ncbi:hypothetical protein AAMO2058_001258000 [Amorphochlora amoebiformis]
MAALTALHGLRFSRLLCRCTPIVSKRLSTLTMFSSPSRTVFTMKEKYMPQRRGFAFTVSVDEFNAVSEDLFDILQESLEDDELPFEDMEFSSGVLSLVTEQGVWIVNKHSASRQVWLSSPKSGPSKFEYNKETQKWVSEREDKTAMHDLLVRELSELVGEEFSFTAKF